MSRIGFTGIVFTENPAGTVISQGTQTLHFLGLVGVVLAGNETQITIGGAGSGTPNAVMYYDGAGAITAGIAGFTFIPATGSGQLILGTANVVNAAATRVLVVGNTNTLAAGVVRSAVIGNNNSISSISVGSLVAGVLNSLVEIQSSLISGASHSMDPGTSINNAIVTGASMTFNRGVDQCVVFGGGTIVNSATNPVSSLIGGDSHNILGNQFDQSILSGTGNTIIAGGVSTNSIVSGNGHTIKSIGSTIVIGSSNQIAPTGGAAGNSIFAGDTNQVLGTNFDNGMMLGANNTLQVGSQAQRSIITGINHDLSGNHLSSIIAGSDFLTTNAASVVDRSIICGSAITLAAGGTISRSLVVGSSSAIKNIVSCLVGGTLNDGGVGALVDSVACGNNLRPENSSQSALFGRDHQYTGLDRVMLAGDYHKPGRSDQTLVGTFYPSGDTKALFGVGYGTSDVARARAFSVEDTGLVRREAGGLREKSRADAGAVVTVDANTDYIILLTNGAAQTVNLPAGVDGMSYYVKDAAGVAGHTINANGADVFEGGGAALVTAAPYRSYKLHFRNGTWWILAIA